MPTAIAHSERRDELPTGTMRAAVFERADRSVLELVRHGSWTRLEAHHAPITP
jgi:hypothetical protein